MRHKKDETGCSDDATWLRHAWLKIIIWMSREGKTCSKMAYRACTICKSSSLAGWIGDNILWQLTSRNGQRSVWPCKRNCCDKKKKKRLAITFKLFRETVQTDLDCELTSRSSPSWSQTLGLSPLISSSSSFAMLVGCWWQFKQRGEAESQLASSESNMETRHQRSAPRITKWWRYRNSKYSPTAGYL